MSGRLEGKIALISGGTSGIGEATVELFAKEGAKVVFTGRSEEKGQGVAERIGNGVSYVPCDVMKEEDIERAVAGTLEQHGTIDILFNNAGGPAGRDLESVTGDEIQYGMGLLFGSVALGMKHVIPVMKKNGGGRIINNSSVAAIRNNQGSLLYSAAKAAVTHYSKLAGVELGPHNITVNCISPGAIATPIFWGGSQRANTLTDEENARKFEKLQNNLAKATPMPMSGLAEDIATAALFLASEDGKFVNSHDLVVDGGRTSMFVEPG